MSEKRDPYDGEYIGNIWGWKFSLFGLALILLLLAVIAYRHYTLQVPLGLEEEAVDPPAPQDTTKLKEEQ
jgi:predicted MFS family arabinose efflux permease